MYVLMLAELVLVTLHIYKWIELQTAPQNLTLTFPLEISKLYCLMFSVTVYTNSSFIV